MMRIDKYLADCGVGTRSEVKKYIKALVKGNNSPYFVYCINTYYFNKNLLLLHILPVLI